MADTSRGRADSLALSSGGTKVLVIHAGGLFSELFLFLFSEISLIFQNLGTIAMKPNEEGITKNFEIC